MSRIAPVAVLGATILAVAPAAAQAASKPTVSTGLAGGITPQSATLTGAVNPQGANTRYWFQFGLTTKLGTATPKQSAGKGEAAVGAVAGITGLQANKTYHYRIVARNGKGTTVGKKRRFKTPVLPLNFTVAASPNILDYRETTTIAGTLGGTNNAKRQIQIQRNQWPYTAGFQPVGNTLLTNDDGTFALPVLESPFTSVYRVATTGKSPIISPPFEVPVRVEVDTIVGHTRVNRNARLQFRGKVRPAKVGVQVGVQKLTSKKTWATIAGSRTTEGGAPFARYKLRAKIRGTGGLYRVFVKVDDGSNVSHHGETIRIRTRR
ncbi:MAG: hypothetical protein AB7G37_20530 [Solirubrobacteraceae bacterium]